MAWHYDPPTPDTEAQIAMASYQNRLRTAEERNLLEVDIDDRPSTARNPDSGRSRNPMAAFFVKLAQIWKKPRREDGTGSV